MSDQRPAPPCPMHEVAMVPKEGTDAPGEQTFRCLVTNCGIEHTRPINPVTKDKIDNEL